MSSLRRQEDGSRCLDVLRLCRLVVLDQLWVVGPRDWAAVLAEVRLGLGLAFMARDTATLAVDHFVAGTSKRDWPYVVGFDCDTATDVRVSDLALVVVAVEDVLSPPLGLCCAGAVFTTGAWSASFPTFAAMVFTSSTAVAYQRGASFVAADLCRSWHWSPHSMFRCLGVSPGSTQRRIEPGLTCVGAANTSAIPMKTGGGALDVLRQFDAR